MKKWFAYKNNQVLVLVLGLIITAILIQLSSIQFMGKSIALATAPLKKSDYYQASMLEGFEKSKDHHLRVLKKQYEICQNMKEYKEGVAVSYYVYYYSFSICSIVFTTLLSIGGIFLANKGWQTADPLLKAFLMTCIGISSIFYFLPKVLNNDENIKNCAEKVKSFENTQLEILNICHHRPSLHDTIMDSKISTIYSKISSDFDFMTDLDYSAIDDYKEIVKSYNIGK